ncbi:MAG: Cof-type HAD-IIB family hydrolase [Treponema sp.]|nr:Cof-type HAD-IIB family hydrolase [Treponema sp.]
MNKVRLMALDLDDTLLRSDLTISYRTRNAIKKAEATGVKIVLASGRVPAAMDRYAKLLGLHKHTGFLICSNGTIIQQSDTQCIISESRLESKKALIAYDLADAEGFPVQIYEDDIMYVSRHNEYTGCDQKLTGLRQVVVENFRAMVSSGCHKLLIPGDPMLLPSMEKLLRSFIGDDISLFTSKPYFLEILPAHIDKGSALAKIAELLDIKREEVLAIGDSMNDESMIRWAGIGIAMANGDLRIKTIADFITEKSNDDDGVVEVIEKYVLKRTG